MENSFNLEDLFDKEFGYVPIPFGFTSVNRNQYTRLGSPYTAKDLFGRQYYLPITLGGIALPYPVMKITCKKTIVETSLVNRTGTVKELISIQDYQIEINGLMISKNNFFPDQVVMQLRDLYKQNSSLIISSTLTDILLCQPEIGGSDHVVITELDFLEPKGMNVRPYKMLLNSDAPFELIKTTNS